MASSHKDRLAVAPPQRDPFKKYDSGGFSDADGSQIHKKIF